MPGTLILCATPIGNLGDISTRLVDTLESADVVYAEDTRRSGQLLSHLGIAKPLRSYFAGNERSRNAQLAEDLTTGQTVALVSDAGMPTVSDPGSSAVAIAVECGATVTAIPGPSAPTMAVAVSGFDGDRFVFEGFLPRKGKDRDARIASIAADERTTVIFCSPQRVVKDLADLVGPLGEDRRIVVTREMTKLHEEIWRGSVSQAAARWADDGERRGEFTVVIEGGEPKVADLGAAVRAVEAMIDAGDSTSHAVKVVAAEHGVRKNELYDAVVGGET